MDNIKGAFIWFLKGENGNLFSMAEFSIGLLGKIHPEYQKYIFCQKIKK